MKQTLCTLMLALLPAAAYSAPLELKKSDHISYIGNTLADRTQHQTSELQGSGIKVDYFEPAPGNVALATLAKLKPKASGVVPKITIDVPQVKQRGNFALRFTGSINIAKSGKYTFYTNSDDGSRLYLDNKLVVNNDGIHGMQERSGKIELTAGTHHLVVTYFNGIDAGGLSVSWAGPGIKKQAIPANVLTSSGSSTLHGVAIRSLKSIPGLEHFKGLGKLKQLDISVSFTTEQGAKKLQQALPDCKIKF